MLKQAKLNIQFNERSNGIRIRKEEVYHNTKMMLSLYRKVKWRLMFDLDDIDADCHFSVDTTLFKYVESMVDIDKRVDQKRIARRLESIEGSKSIINYIDKSMELLSRFPDKGMLYRNLLNDIYFDEKSVAIDSLTEKYRLSRATLFREKKKAIELLGVILWGFMSKINSCYFKDKV